MITPIQGPSQLFAIFSYMQSASQRMGEWRGYKELMGELRGYKELMGEWRGYKELMIHNRTVTLLS